MLNFKDMIAQDLKTFINPLEFSSSHNINGRDLIITVDNDRLKERSKKEYDGITVGEILYFVSASEYGELPEVEEIQIFDKRHMQVFDARVDNGLYEIILKRNE